MWGTAVPSYNDLMTTTHQSQATHFATAGLVLEALAARDFARLASAMAPDGTMEALLPIGLWTCLGPEEVRGAFETWFGDAVEFEVADASVGTVGPLLQLRWRLSVRSPSRGGERMVVEQHAYARTDPSGRVERLALVCSGYQLPEGPPGA
jgi:ketosteroid isomerase-like protein